MFRRGTRYPSAPSPGRPSTARISSLSSGETSSSASTERIQSLVACSRAKFFCAANPGHGRTQTRSVNSHALWPVLSLDSASTTTSSSAQVRLSRQALSRSSSLRVTTTAETLPLVILAAAARPVASAGGLTQAHPGCVPHSPFIPPEAARPVASAGGLTQARPGCVPHSPFIPPGAARPVASAGGLTQGPPRRGPPSPFFSPEGARPAAPGGGPAPPRPPGGPPFSLLLPPG